MCSYSLFYISSSFGLFFGKLFLSDWLSLGSRAILSLTAGWRFLLLRSDFSTCGSNWNHEQCSYALSQPSLVVFTSLFSLAEVIFKLWVRPTLHISFSCLWRMWSFVADPNVFRMLFILLYLILRGEEKYCMRMISSCKLDTSWRFEWIIIWNVGCSRPISLHVYQMLSISLWWIYGVADVWINIFSMFCCCFYCVTLVAWSGLFSLRTLRIMIGS